MIKIPHRAEPSLGGAEPSGIMHSLPSSIADLAAIASEANG